MENEKWSNEEIAIQVEHNVWFEDGQGVAPGNSRERTIKFVKQALDAKDQLLQKKEEEMERLKAENFSFYACRVCDLGYDEEGCSCSKEKRGYVLTLQARIERLEGALKGLIATYSDLVHLFFVVHIASSGATHSNSCTLCADASKASENVKIAQEALEKPLDT